MAVALRSPSRVSALMPVDNAPENAPLRSDFDKYVRGMQKVEAEKITKQSDADKILQDYEPVRFVFRYTCFERVSINLSLNPTSPSPFANSC